MKIITAGIFLATLVCAAQTSVPKACKPCKKCIDIIPEDAVESIQNGSSPAYCPREDYELKWYIQEDVEPHSASWYEVGGISYYGTPSGKVKTTRYFKPMCVPKEN